MFQAVLRSRATLLAIPSLRVPSQSVAFVRHASSSLAAEQPTLHQVDPQSQYHRQSPVPVMEGIKSGPAYAEMAGRIQPQLLRGLQQMGYTNMTPVQQQVLQLPSFTQDCLVQAKTGTGKTIAFLLPALNNLLTARNVKWEKVSILILAPTRELAQQIADECDKLTSQCNPPLECHLATGGSSRKANMNKFLKGKPTILVATPGRMIDYLTEVGPRQKLDEVRCVVLDEADRMLDQGFLPDLMKILAQLPPKKEGNWQGMCFSATMPPEINKVLHNVLKPDHARLSTLTANDTPTVDAIPQSLITVDSIEGVFPMLHKVLSCERIDNPSLKAIIFSSTARQASLMYQIFGLTGGAGPGKLPVYQMHSRLSQTQRNRTVEEFKAATSGLLFASDVVGRGMDFPDIGLVVQVGLPMDKEQYVHRVGRTGRAGKQGRAVMILIPDEMNFIRRNREFPIKQITFDHPKAAAIPSEKILAEALAKVPEQTKAQAYVAFLGFTKTLKRVHGLDAPEVVKLANRFATGAMGMDEPPPLEASTVGKMGLKGVAGITIFGKNGIPRSENKRPNPRMGSGMKKNMDSEGGQSNSSGGGGRAPKKQRRDWGAKA